MLPQFCWGTDIAASVLLGGLYLLPQFCWGAHPKNEDSVLMDTLTFPLDLEVSSWNVYAAQDTSQL